MGIIVYQNKFANDSDFDVVTNQIIEEKLAQIGELATSSFTYSGKTTQTNTRQILGANIPGTTNSVEIKYSGVIKVGYQIDNIKSSVDNVMKIIYIKLPKPEVLDNYIIMDQLECTDNNNILNPINSKQFYEYFDTIEQEELAKAEARGIYDEARERLDTVLTNFFAEFHKYHVIISG